jgi:hypothetical protein
MLGYLLISSPQSTNHASWPKNDINDQYLGGAIILHVDGSDNIRELEKLLAPSTINDTTSTTINKWMYSLTLSLQTLKDLSRIQSHHPIMEYCL